jgi:hypothetical protein
LNGGLGAAVSPENIQEIGAGTAKTGRFTGTLLAFPGAVGLFRSPFMSSASPSRQPAESQISTTLKWASDGELSALDLERILARLRAVDPAAEALSAQLQPQR